MELIDEIHCFFYNQLTQFVTFFHDCPTKFTLLFHNCFMSVATNFWNCLSNFTINFWNWLRKFVWFFRNQWTKFPIFSNSIDEIRDFCPRSFGEIHDFFLDRLTKFMISFRRFYARITQSFFFSLRIGIKPFRIIRRHLLYAGKYGEIYVQ